MGILDEAIREHLALKRQHGTDPSELKQLEDEAFGPPDRPGASEDAPDPVAEAPTEFMTQPDLRDEAGEGEAAVGGELPPQEESPEEKPPGRREVAEGILDLQEAPKEEPSGGEEQEEQQAAEHDAVTQPPKAPEQDAEDVEDVEETPSSPRGDEARQEPHSTEEREAIAEQPTQLYDVEGELSGAERSSDEGPVEAFDEEQPAGEEPLPDTVSVDEDDDDFFSEQRLSDELDRALEAPGEDTPEEEEVTEAGADESPAEAEPEEAGTAEHDSAYEEHEEHDAEHGGTAEREEPGEHEDVLEDTPEFLEGSEDDQLWFEQKPPKDFDFDD